MLVQALYGGDSYTGVSAFAAGSRAAVGAAVGVSMVESDIVASLEAFTQAAGLTGVILTKLDGTAKGGVALAVQGVLEVPVRFIGVGEGMEDLLPFDPMDFARALLEQ